MSGPGLPPSGGDRRQLAAAVNALLQGRSRNTGSVTLTPSAASTVLRNPLISGGSTILLVPRTASAGSLAASLHVAAKEKGMAVLAHAISPAGDLLFDYAVIG